MSTVPPASTATYSACPPSTVTPVSVGFAQLAADTKLFGCSSWQKAQTPQNF